ncbi:MAG: carbohydrate ABC transporter permease [Lachnospirales bacterium]
MSKKRINKLSILTYLCLFILGFLTFYPLIFTILTSFKDNEQFFKSFWGFPNPLVLGNYRNAFQSLLPYIFNSFYIAAVSILLILVSTSLSAYAFARLTFPFKEKIFAAILALMMIPGMLQLIPRFQLLISYGLLNTYSGIIIGYVASAQTMAIFIIRSFLDSQPEELYEAARIDGATEVRTFTNIALPLLKPVLGTVAIINLLTIWNDYLWPLVVTSDENLFTMALGLLKYTSSFGNTTLYGPMFAGYVVASLPLVILFLFFMDYFMEGLTAGAVKM